VSEVTQDKDCEQHPKMWWSEEQTADPVATIWRKLVVEPLVARGVAKAISPYLTWTRKFENKTLTRALSTEQLERYGPWFEEHRRLRQLTKDLEVISLRAANRIEQWGLPDGRDIPRPTCGKGVLTPEFHTFRPAFTDVPYPIRQADARCAGARLEPLVRVFSRSAGNRYWLDVFAFHVGRNLSHPPTRISGFAIIHAAAIDSDVAAVGTGWGFDPQSGVLRE